MKSEGDKLNHQGNVLYSENDTKIISCSICGFAHVLPLPSTKSVESFYENEFYEKMKLNYIKKHTEDLDWWKTEFDDKYQIFQDNLSNIDNPRLLDIGSGPGYFIQEGKKRGWEVQGIEPGGLPYHFSADELGVEVFRGVFSAKTYKKFGKFHVVHMNNVLEHMINPHQILTMIREILYPGGILCVTVPNDFNPLQKILVNFMKKESWWVNTREHVNYFNMNSLTGLFESNDYQVFEKTATFPLEMFVMMGDDYIGDSERGRKIHQKRKNLEITFHEADAKGLKREIYRNLARLGIGREITVYGSRK